MSFENCLPFVFSEEAIRKNAPATSGVYGLSNARQWLYIGETDNIRESLLTHVGVPLTSEPNNDPAGFSFERSGFTTRVSRQQYLVVELSPAFQQRHVRHRWGG